MKRPDYILLLLFSCLAFQSSAQTTSKKFKANTQNYFLQTAHARLTNLLSQSSYHIAEEKNMADVLSRRSDSMLTAGNMFDSTSLLVKERLLRNTKKADSCSFIINKLQTSINNAAQFKKNFTSMEAAVTNLSNYVFSDTLQTKLNLKTTKAIIDGADLSGEKAGMKAILGKANNQLDKEGGTNSAIGNKKGDALASGKIDEKIANKIDRRLTAYQRKMDSLKTEISGLQSKIESPSEFRKDFKLIKAKVVLIDSVVNKGAVGREFIFKMLDDGITKSTKNLFELAAFFGPGGYIIPKEKLSVARTYFLPIVDSLVKFSNNYNSVFRTASITVNGYSDATSISSESKLYTKLCTYLNAESADKQQLNTALSALRAEEISKLLSELLKEKYPNFKSIDKIVFETFEVGQGEKLPTTTITDYKINDSRRRVVIIYWNILPIE